MPSNTRDCRRAQRFLLRPRRLAEIIACQQIHISTLQSKVGSPDLGIRVTGSAPADRTAYLACKISEMREETARLERQQALALVQVKRLLRGMPSPRAACLLEMRYLSGLTWSAISDALHLTPRTALRLHQRALRLVQQLLEDRENDPEKEKGHEAMCQELSSPRLR